MTCIHVSACGLWVFCFHSRVYFVSFIKQGSEVNMAFGTGAAVGDQKCAHCSHYPLLHPQTSYIPQKHLVPLFLSPSSSHSCLIAPAQVLAVGQGGLRVRGSQLCKCFQLLCDWNRVLLFDPMPRQAWPWLFLAAAGDERMSA